MTATYDPNISTDKDKVRIYIGDTIVSSALISDEEIAGMLAIYTNPLYAAASICDGLAGRFAKSVSFSVEGLSISNGQKASAYRLLAESLRKRAASGAGQTGSAGLNSLGGAPFVGGISKDEISSNNDDNDRSDNKFAVTNSDGDPPPAVIDTSDWP